MTVLQFHYKKKNIWNIPKTHQRFKKNCNSWNKQSLVLDGGCITPMLIDWLILTSLVVFGVDQIVLIIMPINLEYFAPLSVKCDNATFATDNVHSRSDYQFFILTAFYIDNRVWTVKTNSFYLPKRCGPILPWVLTHYYPAERKSKHNNKRK